MMQQNQMFQAALINYLLKKDEQKKQKAQFCRFNHYTLTYTLSTSYYKEMISIIIKCINS